MESLWSLCLRVDVLCLFAFLPCLFPLSLTNPALLFLPQKRSLVCWGRFPVEVCGPRNPPQSGPLSGAVLLSAQSAADLMDIGTEGLAQWGPSRFNKTHCPLQQSPIHCSFISLLMSAILDCKRSSVSCWVCPRERCLTAPWIKQHICFNAQAAMLIWDITHRQSFFLCQIHDATESGRGYSKHVLMAFCIYSFTQ